MNGTSGASRYVAKEEINLGRGSGVGVGSGRPPPAPSSPPNPFAGGVIGSSDSGDDDDDDDSDYVNGDDAYPDNAIGDMKRKGRNVELWKDDIRSNNRKSSDGGSNRISGGNVRGGARSFEMVPLSPEEELWDNDDDEGGVEFTEFNYDDEDGIDADSDDDDRRARRGKQSTCLAAPFGGDDYSTSSTLLPKSVYQYLYPPGVPRAVQLCRPENLAVPACYLLVGLLQGLSAAVRQRLPAGFERV